MLAVDFYSTYTIEIHKKSSIIHEHVVDKYKCLLLSSVVCIKHLK